MRDEVKIVVLLGRAIDLITESAEPTDDHRTTLHALAELLARRSVTVVADGQGLSIEAERVPDETPFAATLLGRLQAHGVARVSLAFGTPPADLVELIRGLAEAPGRVPAEALGSRLDGAGAVGIGLVTRDRADRASARAPKRMTDALAAPAPEAPAAPARRAQPRSRQGTLAGNVERLRDVGEAQLLQQLDGIQADIVRAINANELTRALEAVLQLVDQEAASKSPDAVRAYGIALRRLLSSEHLKRFAPLVFDEVYHDDTARLMRRAGKQGTKILLDLLIEAPSQAERRAYLKALRQIEEGADVIASLLSHHEWFVVRNAADLAGELRIVEAVPALAKVVQHDEPRVRRAVGLALARIATPETALPLRRLITDPDASVRIAVVKEVGGRGLSGLAMPLVSAASSEEDPDVMAEYYRALGRIGTPDAVAALVKVAKQTGGLLSRKPSGPRLAAIEALGVAGGSGAVATLKELLDERSGDVRAAAASAMERARASEA